MNKLAKTIIGILVGIIVVLLIIIVTTTSKNKCKNDELYNTNTSDEIKQLLGVYHYTNPSNARQNLTLILNEDMTCKYYEKDECKWTLSDDKKEISIHLATYRIAFDKGERINAEGELSNLGGISDDSATKEECESKLLKYGQEYNLTNPRCEYVTEGFAKPTATIINGGLLINNNIYNKIG